LKEAKYARRGKWGENRLTGLLVRKKERKLPQTYIRGKVKSNII